MGSVIKVLKSVDLFVNRHRRKESGVCFFLEKAHFIYRSDARNIHRSQTKRQETRGPPDGHKTIKAFSTDNVLHECDIYSVGDLWMIGHMF